jgi:hypothetical protein
MTANEFRGLVDHDFPGHYGTEQLATMMDHTLHLPARIPELCGQPPAVPVDRPGGESVPAGHGEPPARGLDQRAVARTRATHRLTELARLVEREQRSGGGRVAIGS